MICPACGHGVVPGTAECDHCSTSLVGEDDPQVNARTRLQASLNAWTIADLGPTPPVSLDQGAPLRDAVDTLREQRIGAVQVTGTEGRLVEIVTEHDLTLKVAGRGVDLAATTVGELMTPRPDCVRAEHPLAHALQLMHVGDHRHLPLVDDEGRPAGMVSSRDVIDFLDSHLDD